MVIYHGSRVLLEEFDCSYPVRATSSDQSKKTDLTSRFFFTPVISLQLTPEPAWTFR